MEPSQSPKAQDKQLEPNSRVKLLTSIVYGLAGQLALLLGHVDFIGLVMAIIFILIGRFTDRGRSSSVDGAVVGGTMLVVEASAYGLHYLLFGRF